MRCDCGGVLDVKNDFTNSFDELLNRKEIDTERFLEFMPVKRKYIPDLTPPITPNIGKKIDD
ncbi:MAG: threonine synthase, partial [Thermoplasmata archaeon]